VAARYTEFSYPDFTTRTYVWTPSIDPIAEGGSSPTARGVLQDIMGDGSVWSNRLRVEKTGRTWRFAGLTLTDRVNYLAFLAAVGGLAMKIRDPIDTGGAGVTARLFGAGIEPNFERMKGGLYAVTIELRF
jgi:hypothetical protein